MYFDALTMAAVAAELKENILGGRVQDVMQTAPLAVGLEIYFQHRRLYLLASAHTDNARVHLVEGKLTRSPTAHGPILLHLRRRMRGAILQEIEAPPLERVLFLRFYHPGLEPEEQKVTLVVEVMGRHSNIILLDEADSVLDSIKRVTPQMSGPRPILPRRPYQLPPRQAKTDPRRVSALGLSSSLVGIDPETLLWRALVNLYAGISPLLAREIVFRACGQIDLPLSAPCPLDQVAAEILDFWSRPAAGRWEPCLALKEGIPTACAPYLLTQRPDWEVQPTAGISQALEQYYNRREPATRHHQTRQLLLQAVARQRERVQKRLEALQGELDHAAQAEEMRLKGEWLLAYQRQVQPRQTVLQVEGLEIALDPNRSAVENAQEYFAAYRKATQASRDQPERIEEARQELAWLEQMAALVESAESYDELGLLARELEQAQIFSPRPGTSRRRAPLPPRSFRSTDGLTILVGRNARQNEEISLRRARPNDLWFHARGKPGAHVVVLTEGRPVPDTTVEEAAALAAYYSQGRGETRVAVDWTECRHLRRTTPAHPGLVHYDHERTVTVSPTRLLQETQPDRPIG